MRKSLIGLVITTLMAFGASSTANAVSLNWVIASVTGTATVSGQTVTAEIGDTITLQLILDNTGGDAIVSLFTTMQFDTSVINLTGGGTAATLLAGPNFGDPALGVIAQPAQKFGQPAGDFIQLAHGSTAGPATGLGPELAGQLIFTVVGSGITSLTHFIGVGDEAIINGVSNIIGNSPGIFFGPDVVVVVPEPGTALLMGLGLTGLSMAGTRRRRV